MNVRTQAIVFLLHAAPTSQFTRSVTADPDKDWTRLASESLMPSAHGAHVDDSLIGTPDWAAVTQLPPAIKTTVALPEAFSSDPSPPLRLRTLMPIPLQYVLPLPP